MTKDKRAEIVTAIWQDITKSYFRLQGLGRELGAVNASNGSTWGVLNTLITHGPATVPDIARMRPVSRQHIQMLANELVAAGLAEFKHNPRHRRSKLLAITELGREAYQQQTGALTSAARDMVGDLSEEELAIAARVIGTLRERLEERGSDTDMPEPEKEPRRHRRRSGMHAGFRRRHRAKQSGDA